MTAWELSAERVAELYAHYDFYSRRGGALYVGGQFVPIDLSADRARDEAAAQANLAAAKARIAQISAECGLTAAEAAARAGDEAVTSALCDIVAYTPANAEEGRAKAAYLLRVVVNGSDFFDEAMTRKLVASFAGPDAARLLAATAEANEAAPL